VFYKEARPLLTLSLYTVTWKRKGTAIDSSFETMLGSIILISSMYLSLSLQNVDQFESFLFTVIVILMTNWKMVNGREANIGRVLWLKLKAWQLGPHRVIGKHAGPISGNSLFCFGVVELGPISSIKPLKTSTLV